VRPFVAHDWHPIRKLTTNIDRPGPSVIVRHSQLLETLHPVGKTPFVEAPLAANLESGQFFCCTIRITVRLDSCSNSAVCWMVSNRIGSRSFFYRRFHGIPNEQRQCHDSSKHSRPFSAKSSNLPDQLDRTEFDQPERRGMPVKIFTLQSSRPKESSLLFFSPLHGGSIAVALVY